MNTNMSIHTITSPNSIMAPAPTALTVTIITPNNINNVNAKIINNTIIITLLSL